MKYKVICLFPYNRNLYLDGHNFKYEENGEKEGNILYHSAVIPQLSSDKIDENIEITPSGHDISVKISLIDKEGVSIPIFHRTDLEKRFHFHYIDRLFFQHEKDFRSLQFLRYDIDQMDEIDRSDRLDREDIIDSSETRIYKLSGMEKSRLVQGKIEGQYTIQYISDTIQYGLFTNQDLEEGYFIGEYTGVVSRISSERGYSISNYSLHYPSLDGSFQIDAKEYGNILRFINHSNSPNTRFDIVCNDGVFHIICVTSCYITNGSQITVNYGPSYWLRRGIEPDFV